MPPHTHTLDSVSFCHLPSHPTYADNLALESFSFKTNLDSDIFACRHNMACHNEDVCLSFHSQATSSGLNPKSSMLQQHCQLAWWNVFFKQWTHSRAITWSAQSTLAKYTTPSWTRFGPVKSLATRSKCGCNTSTDKSPMQNIHWECELSHILLYLPLRISQEGLILLAHLIFFASRAPVPFQQVCTTC